MQQAQRRFTQRWYYLSAPLIFVYPLFSGTLAQMINCACPASVLRHSPPEPNRKWRNYEECSGCACEALQVVKALQLFVKVFRQQSYNLNFFLIFMHF